MKKGKLFFLLSITVLLIIFIFPTNVLSVDKDYNFTFNSDVFHSETNTEGIVLNNTFNMINQSYSNGTYPATYSFTNGNFDGFTISQNGGSVKVIPELGGHSQIAELIDIDNSDDVWIRSDFNGNELGTVEFWIRSNDSEKAFDILCREITSNGPRIKIDEGKVQYHHSGSWHDAPNGAILNNLWYHFRVDFDCNTDTFNFYLNGILSESDILFQSNIDFVNNVHFSSIAVDNDYIYYLDAIGYSWENTFAFNDDIVGSEPEGWEIYNTGSCTSLIIANFDGNSNVLELHDNDITGSFSSHVKKLINQEIDQSISFDIATSSIAGSREIDIWFKENENNIIQFKIETDDLANVEDHTYVKTNFIVVDTFFNIKVVLDDTSNNFSVYIDDILEYVNVYTLPTNTSINFLEFKTTSAPFIFSNYIDNINISSINGYSIGQNKFQEIYINNSIKEVDKFEFAIEKANKLYDVGHDNPSGWNDIENGQDNTNIAIDNTDAFNNRVVQIVGNGTTHEITGIEKDFSGIENGVIDIIYNLNFTKTDNNVGGINCSIYSYDDTLMTMINIERFNLLFGMKIDYFDGTDYITLLGLTSPLTVNAKITFEIHIDKWITFNLKENDILIGNYNFEKIDITKEGFGKIKFESIVQDDGGQDNICNLHNVGIYIDSTSISDDFGYLSKKVYVEGSDITSYHFKFWSNYYITALGSFQTLITSNHDYVFEGNTESIEIFKDYDGSESYINLYPNDFVHFPSFFGIYKPMLLFFCNNQLYISEIKIEGIRMTYTNITFAFEYDYGGVDYNKSYFYVDSSNRLQFTHTAINNNTEYIQAIFTLEPLELNSSDAAIKWSSYKTLKAYGYIAIDYFTSTDIFDIEPYSDFKKVQITPEKKVWFLNILITDNDDDDILGLTTGYIKNISFLKISDISVSIITLNLIGMIIPLIIILLPTLLFSEAYGKFLIIPFFLLMSILCVATEIIPIWLFFVIALSLSTFLLKQKGEGQSQLF